MKKFIQVMSLASLAFAGSAARAACCSDSRPPCYPRCLVEQLLVSSQAQARRNLPKVPVMPVELAKK